MVLDVKKLCDAVIMGTSYSPMMSKRSLLSVGGMSILNHIVGRLHRVAVVDKIILATTMDEVDDELAVCGEESGLIVYRGDYEDLIGRLSGAAQLSAKKNILRVLGNSPLVDPEILTQMVWLHANGEWDFTYNEHEKGVILGTGGEVINRDFLLELDADNELTINQRKLGLIYVHQNPHRYKIQRWAYDNPRPSYRVNIESNKDVALLEAIFSQLRVPRLESIIQLLDENPILAQSNRLDSQQKEVGLEKLWLFPDKLGAIQEANELDESYPVSVELSLTNNCNLNCVWCSDADLRRRGDHSELDFDVFKRLILDLKAGGTRGIVVEGGGEPTVYKYFEEAIDFIVSTGIACGVITNGVKRISAKTLSKLQWIRVSLDASNPLEFKESKGRDQYETVLDNIGHYAQHCKMTGVGYVVTKNNSADLDSLVLRLRSIGVSYIQFRPVIDHPEMISDTDIRYLLRYVNKNSFNVIVDGMKENRITGNDGNPCLAHSLTSVIAADGSVYLCGRLNIYPWLSPLGRVGDQSFREIWLGAERRKQSLMVRDNNFCLNNCPECRLSKFNSVFARINKITTVNFI